MIALTRVLCMSARSVRQGPHQGQRSQRPSRIAGRAHLPNNKVVRVSASQIMTDAIDLRLEQYPGVRA